MGDRLAHGLQNRPGPDHVRLGSADEHRQRSEAGALGATGNRGVQQTQALLGEPAAEVPSRVRRDGRTIDHETASPPSLGHATRTEENDLHVWRVRNANEDDVRGRGYVGRRLRFLRSAFYQGGGPSRRAIPDGQSCARLEQVGGHGGAHRP